MGSGVISTARAVEMTPDPIAQRIARARLLADRYPASADILTFYAELAEQQRTVLGTPTEAALSDERLVAVVPALLDWLERAAPEPLARSTAQLRRLGVADWHRWLDLAFSEAGDELGPPDNAAAWVAEVLVQPFAERAAVARAGRGGQADARCPACGRLPVVGVLREAGHGARRALVCVRCATEWAYRRLCCPGCGEDEFEALPVYTSDALPHIRVEACDRCRRYLKTVDLSKDGLAVPQIDDLASLPLDLWARGEGYIRLQPNLLRI